MLEYEDAVQRAAAAVIEFEGEVIPSGEDLCWTDVPVTKGRGRVLELSFDLQKLIDCLRSGEQSGWPQGSYFYMWREVSRKTDQLEQISDWMAALLRACDGTTDIQAVVRQLASELSNVDASSREYVSLRLLQGAQAQGIIDVYRPASQSLSMTLSA